ncbi:MAG: TolC family protein [Deltaproteobacteria bacterium]|nr:TolC family protein [Candidatus Tharpella sp.]
MSNFKLNTEKSTRPVNRISWRNSVAINFFLVFLLCAFLPSGVAAAETFTLSQAVEYGLNHKASLQAAGLEVDKAAASIKAVAGSFMPQLTAGLSYSRIYSLSADGPTDVDYVDQLATAASLRLSQTIFAGFRYLNSYERARLEKNYAEIELGLQRLATVHDIQVRFIQLLKSRHELEAFAQGVRRGSSSLKAAQAYFEKNLIPYADVLQAEVDLEEVIQYHIRARHDIERARLNLHHNLGLSLHEDAVFNGELKALPTTFAPTLETALNTAKSQRLELKVLEKLAEMAKKDEKIAVGNYYPQVAVDLSYIDYFRDYEDEAPMAGGLTYDRDQGNVYWSAAINFQWHFFDGGTNYHNMKKYQLEQLRLQHQAEEVELEIAAQVRDAYLALQDAHQRIVSATKGQAAAREFFQREQERLRIGVGIMPRLLDAQARLARADANFNQALGDCQIARIGLFYSIGVSNHDLGEYSSSD